MAGFSLPGQVPYAPVGGPSDFAVASNAAVRKRKLAEMLQQQALGDTNTIGLNVPGARMSLVNPLAALLQGFASKKLNDDSDAAEAAANKANQEGLAAHIAAMPQNTPGVPSQPIEQEQVGAPPGAAPPPAPPGLTAAFGPQGMPNVGPRDNELTGSGSAMAAQLLGGDGGAPPPNPLAPPGGAPEGPPLLPQKMDMAAPGMLPKLSTDAVPGHTVTPQELFQYGAGFNKFGKAGEDIGKQITGAGIKGMLPMTPDQIAELAQKKELALSVLEQKQEATRLRSEDTRLSIEQRREAAAESAAVRREILEAKKAGAGGAGTPKFGAPEGYSPDGNVVLRGKDGIAHEVINGVPDTKPYGGPVTPVLDQRKATASAEKGSQGLKDLTNALNDVEGDDKLYGFRANLGAVLPAFGGAGAAAGGLNEGQLAKKANIAAMTADITHSLYGSAFSAGEQARAKGFLIDPTDSTAVVKSKLKGRMALEQEHYNALPASAKAAATQRQGGGGSDIDALVNKHTPK